MRATRFLRLLQPCRPKPALDQLRRLYPDLLEAQRVLSWLEQSCGTTPNQDSCLEAKVTAHVERSEPLAYLIGEQQADHMGLWLRSAENRLTAFRDERTGFAYASADPHCSTGDRRVGDANSSTSQYICIPSASAIEDIGYWDGVRLHSIVIKLRSGQIRRRSLLRRHRLFSQGHRPRS